MACYWVLSASGYFAVRETDGEPALDPGAAVAASIVALGVAVLLRLLLLPTEDDIANGHRHERRKRTSIQETGRE